MQCVMTWVSDYAMIRYQFSTTTEDEDELFAEGEDAFEEWHGFRPTEHGFAADDAEFIDD